jgi:phytoene dehydrogenase-like protein
MADKSYDAVVVGGGGNALVTALYLARNGMTVGVFDKRFEIGGEFCTDETLMPGFLMNTCATFIRFFMCPAVYDFNLRQYGLEMIMPEPSQSMIFEDGSCAAIYGTRHVDLDTGKTSFSQENLGKNLKSIAAFSQKDADTCAKWSELSRGRLGELVEEWLYNPPPQAGEKSVEERVMEEIKLDPRWPYMNIGEFAYDVFESDQMRIYYMRLAQGHTGSYPHTVQPLLFNLHQMASAAGGMPVAIVRGGTHNIAHALQRALSSMGGEFFVNYEVDKIVTENGKAKGVVLNDGTTVEAKKLVVYGADPKQLAFRMLPDVMSDEVKKKIRNLWIENYGALWVTFALHELPKYTAESECRDIMTQRCYLSPNDPDYLRYHKLTDCHRNGLPSRYFFHMTHDTAFVPSYAPAGKHLCLIEDYTCEDASWTRAEWEDIRKRTPDSLLEYWRKFAPNMTKDNVIACYVLLGIDVIDRFTWGFAMGINHTAPQMGSFRPIPEWSGFKTHINNLYLCGQTQHPGGSSWGLPGYIAYKVIAGDLGLEKVWETAGRRF